MKLEPLSTNESLKDWFGKGPKGDWVRVGTDGKIKGACARAVSYTHLRAHET